MAVNMSYQVLEALCVLAKAGANKPLEERTEEFLKAMSLRHDELVTAAVKWEVPQTLQNQVCRQALQHPHERNETTIKRALELCNMVFIDGKLATLSEAPAKDNSHKGDADENALSR